MTQFLNKIDLNENEIEELVMNPLSTFPANPKGYRMIFKTPENCLYVFTPSSGWKPMCGGAVTEEPVVTNAVLGEADAFLLSEQGDSILIEIT